MYRREQAGQRVVKIADLVGVAHEGFRQHTTIPDEVGRRIIGGRAKFAGRGKEGLIYMPGQCQLEAPASC